MGDLVLTADISAVLVLVLVLVLTAVDNKLPLLLRCGRRLRYIRPRRVQTQTQTQTYLLTHTHRDITSTQPAGASITLK